MTPRLEDVTTKSLCETRDASLSRRVALVTPYSGDNFGDAAIQDSIIANLRSRMPQIEFAGISLDSENFLTNHDSEHSYPLLGVDRPFYCMARLPKSETVLNQHLDCTRSFKQLVCDFPVVGSCLRFLHRSLRAVWREARHSLGAYKFLKGFHLLIISGGGQLDEEWGGAWGHPFSLFKWSLLARIRGIRCAMVSVGACKTHSRTARLFLKSAMRLSCYRSYRDSNSLAIATAILPRASEDSAVPDLAFHVPADGLHCNGHLRKLAQGRTIVALSPIVYAKPGSWPSENEEVFTRYVAQMELVLKQLLERDYFVVFVWSSLSDRCVIAELLKRVNAAMAMEVASQVHTPEIQGWRDLIAVLNESDVLVASRLHSALLGFVADKPTIAISFDPKVDWLMADAKQTRYLLQIKSFVAEDVLLAVDEALTARVSIVGEIKRFKEEAAALSSNQFDTLRRLVMTA